MSEKLEREALGGNGPIGTNVRENSKGKGPASNNNPPKGRRIGFKHLDSSTVSFFFTRFPAKAKNSDLVKLFESYGEVTEVFVPNKVDKWGRKFGFVKFSEVEDVVELESRLEEVWLWKVRLKVNKARFGREESKGDGEGSSRGAVARGGVSSAKNPPFPWDRSQFPELQKELPVLDIHPSEEMVQYLEGCCVVELHVHLEAVALQQMLVMEGINRVKATTMGEN
jgi:RNA recognition motif-containing protein